MPDDGLNRFDLVDGHPFRRAGEFLEAEKIAQENRRFLFIDQFRPLLKQFVVSCAASQLQFSNRLRVPSMLDAVLSPRELPLILQRSLLLSLLLQPHLVACNLPKAYAPDGADLSAEVSAQQVFAQANALENLCTAIAADGRDAHLRHDFLQALVHGLDIVGLSSGIVFLNLPTPDEVVENSKRHIGTQRTGTIAQEQRCMHCFAYLATFDNEGSLHALADANQMMMDGTHG